MASKIEMIIKFVKANKLLYDHSHPRYKDCRAKDRKWMELGDTMDVDGEKMKGIWKNLRTCYSRHLKAQKTVTGQGAVRRRQWLWAEELEFLRPHLAFASTVTNVTGTMLETGHDVLDPIESADNYTFRIEADVIDENQISREPDVLEETQINREPDVLEETQISREPDVFEETQISREPDVFEETQINREPDVFEETQICREYHVFEETQISREPAASSKYGTIPSKKRKVSLNKTNNATSLSRNIDKIIDFLEHRNKPDSVDMYCMAWAQTIKTLPPDLIIDARQHISEYINELERGNLERNQRKRSKTPPINASLSPSNSSPFCTPNRAGILPEEPISIEDDTTGETDAPLNVEMAEKRKRCSLTVAEKRKIIKYADENPTQKKTDIAKMFEIPTTTLATILKFKDKFSEESGLLANSKRLKVSGYADVEECIWKWLKECRDKNAAIAGPILKQKAQQFALALGHAEFRASNGWLHNFKKRNENIFRKICDESAEGNEELWNEWKNRLAEHTETEANDSDDSDETGLFYKCLKINQRDFTIKDARKSLDVIKCVFLKKGGLNDSIIQSFMVLDCALHMLSTIDGNQTPILDFSCPKKEPN